MLEGRMVAYVMNRPAEEHRTFELPLDIDCYFGQGVILYKVRKT